MNYRCLLQQIFEKEFHRKILAFRISLQYKAYINILSETILSFGIRNRKKILSTSVTYDWKYQVFIKITKAITRKLMIFSSFCSMVSSWYVSFKVLFDKDDALKKLPRTLKVILLEVFTRIDKHLGPNWCCGIEWILTNPFFEMMPCWSKSKSSSTAWWNKQRSKSLAWVSQSNQTPVISSNLMEMVFECSSKSVM